MNTTNGLVYKDGWKGRNVAEFIQHWESKGYRCSTGKIKTVDTGRNVGRGSCSKVSILPICPKTYIKLVSYELDTELIRGRMAQETSLNCF